MTATSSFSWDKKPGDKANNNPDIVSYSSPIEVRSITFILLNGDCHTYYYFELRKLEYEPKDNKLTLKFADEAVILQGRKLVALYETMRKYGIQEIKQLDERYAATKGEDEMFVTSIVIGPLEQPS